MRFSGWVCLLFASLWLSGPASAYQEFEFDLPADASRALMNALFYQNEVPYGSGHTCKLQVVRPEAGEKPLQSDKNMLVCSYTSRTGGAAQLDFKFKGSESNPATKNSVILSGYDVAYLISAIYETFERLGDPLPADSLWSAETKCDSSGVECEQSFFLKSEFRNFGVPLMMCYRHSILTAPLPRVKLDRSKYSSETAYLNALIWKQGEAMERGHDSNTCGFMFDRTRPLQKGATSRSIVEHDPEVKVEASDLKTFSFISRERDGPIFKYAMNSFQAEERVMPGIQQTLADDAEKAEDRIRASGGQSTARHSLYLNRALQRLHFMREVFPDYESSVQRYQVMMSLIPDPDRWFLLSGALWLEWKVVPKTEFLAKIPARLRPLGDQAVSYRSGRTLYVNQGFLDSRFFRTDTMYGIENWLLWETLKLWIPDGDYDYEQFGERFSRFLTQGNLNEFRARDKRGRPGLSFITLTEEMTRKVRATTEWPWLAENTHYFAHDIDHGFEVVMFAAADIRTSDGKVVDTYPFQYHDSKPYAFTERDGSCVAPELDLFCEAAAKHPVTVEITPSLGKFSLQGLNFKWNGIESLPALRKSATVLSVQDCKSRLPLEVMDAISNVTTTF